uniref:Amidase domain-containing protein n=1 Tax=Panagrolaimus sp. JU765 TaxID=591449 RepID=A0AC34RN52_9BILA
MAKEMDEKFDTHDFKKLPLYGLPISVKEATMIKDYDQTMGFVHRIGKVSYRNSNLIQKLIDKGAIPFCLTNVPQSLLTFDCDNPIYGQTRNPFNPTRTCGGSSGGEGALIGSKASLVGFGSDLGGSIRIPAHFCECVGIKPGSTRLSDRDCLPIVPGRPMVKCSEGPLGQNVDICVKILSSLMDEQKYDPTIAPIRWRDSVFHDTKKLKIGFYTDDDWFEPCPAVRRTVLEIVTYLHDHGHQMIGFKPPNIGKAFGLMIGAINVDGGSYLLDLFAN